MWRLRTGVRFIWWRIWEVRIVVRRKIRVTLWRRLVIMVLKKVWILENWTLRKTWLNTGRMNMCRLRGNKRTL